MKGSRARLALWVVLGIAVATLLVVATRSGPATARSRADSIDQRLKCPICGGESVADSNSDVSRSIRALVLQEVRAGKSDDEIIAAIQRSYPDSSLLPAASGLGLVAWGLPVVAFVLAVAGLGAAYARNRRDPRRVASPDDEALVAEARSDG